MNSLRRQLTRRLIVWLALLLGVGLFTVHFAVSRMLVRAFDANLRTRALAIAALSEVNGGRVQFDFSADFLGPYRRAHPRAWFELWSDSGQALARSPLVGTADLPWTAGGTAERPRIIDHESPDGTPARMASLAFTVPEVDPGTTAPHLRLTVAVDRRELDQTLAGLLGIVALCGAALIVAAGFIVPRLLTRGLAPLDALGARAAEIDASSLATRFAVEELPLELEPIASRLNDLLTRLQASFARERQFSSDLAHELRTPLAELRTMAECAIKWPDARDAAHDRECLAIARQMERIVGQLLELARGDEGRFPLETQPVALDTFVRETWDAFADRAAAHGRSVELSLSAGVADADPNLLRQILTNLFENAVDYATPGGRIRLALRCRSDAVSITVANTATELTPEDVARLFDRFWRREPSRTGGVHAGLGLSLAQSFARAMDWSLTARRDHDAMLVLELSGPIRAGSTTPRAAGSVDPSAVHR